MFLQGVGHILVSHVCWTVLKMWHIIVHYVMLFLESTELDFCNLYEFNNMYQYYMNKMCGTFRGMYKNRVFTSFGILQQKWKVKIQIISGNYMLCYFKIFLLWIFSFERLEYYRNFQIISVIINPILIYRPYYSTYSYIL